MRVLILGKNGYLSKRFQEYFKYKNIEYNAISIRGEMEWWLSIILDRAKNDGVSLVINAVGYTGTPNVDACEDNKRECLSVNVILAEKIANICKVLDLPLIHVSSGCIYKSFSGYAYDLTKEYIPEIPFRFKEEDIPNFSFEQGNSGSWYSGTKALAESIVRKTWDKTYICRLRMPFNHVDEDKNYISKIIKYPKVWSANNSLTNIDEFVKVCYELAQTGEYGTYNITNPGGITAKEILEIAKEYGITKEKYEYFEDIEEFSKYIKTPRSDCELDTTKLETLLPGSILPVRESLRKTFESWNKNEKIFW